MIRRAVDFLKRLIATPSISRQEGATADIIESYLRAEGFEPQRLHNNVWVYLHPCDPSLPTLLLNSHHDTVKPSPAYTRQPYEPAVEGDRLYGLGSNDAGASLTGLLHVFMSLKTATLPFNLLFLATAEEEVTGVNGMRAMVRHWAESATTPRWAIIGEPTGMNAALAERGLLVLDCTATAAGGHAARSGGQNALYEAIDDIQTLRNLRFPKESELLGPIKVTATQIAAGTQHNVLPTECKFVVDVRTTDALSNEETVDFIRRSIRSEAIPRSTHIRASAISADHSLVRAAVASGSATFVSPTTSDQSVLPMVDTLKIGIGLSERSHTPDEFVCLSEIDLGIKQYLKIINTFANETLEQGL